MRVGSMSSRQNLTYSLLSVVGSPFDPQRDVRVDGSNDISSLYCYAAKNRMALLCLDSLAKRGMNVSSDDCEKLAANYAQALELTVRVSNMLERSGVDYAFFKSLRPYRETTVDVDVLVFSSDYGKALEEMSRAGYLQLVKGPLSATFKDPASGLNVDIYDEIGVSYLIYLDKEKLGNHVERRRISGGDFIRTLSPSADLLALISHSVLKEQMYVLSEYYSTLFCLQDDPSETVVSSLRSLAERCNLKLALEIHLGITASLHRDVHGFVPKCIMDTWDDLQIGSWEFSRARRLGIGFPLKYHPVTIAKALARLLKESKGRRSIALQAAKMFDPRFSPSVARELFNHISRETY